MTLLSIMNFLSLQAIRHSYILVQLQVETQSYYLKRDINMKKIKIFLASALNELSEQRNELARFILGVNNHLIDEDFYVDLQLCEELDPAFVLSRKQDEYNAYIQNADYVFFLFLSHVGQYTKEEFEIAYAHFQQHQTPHILTYFYREHVADITCESGQFAEELSEKYGHYYCICNNLETIKLALLLQISQCFSTLKQVTLKNGRICLNDVDYLSMQQTDVIAGNQEYQKIVNELNTLTEKIELLANERPLQEDLLIEYNRQKDDLLSRKLSIEEQSLAYMSKIYDDIIHGSISALKAKLYRLIEQGRITEADQLLSMSSMEGFQNSHQQFFAQQQELAKECIDLYQQKISLTRMQKLTPDRIELIHTCYQKIKTIVELTGHSENTLIPYLHFLEETDQNPDEIEDLTAYIQWCYMKPGYQVPLKDYSDLYNELLHHYEANQNHKKASELLTQFVEKVESSSETDAFILCEACIRIQTHYRHIYPDLDTIRYWQKEALHYAEQSDSDYQKAICYKEMGGIAGLTENFDEMENYFSESLTYMEQLYNNNPEKWISEYIKLCLMYGNIYQNKANELTESTNDIYSFVSDNENGAERWEESIKRSASWREKAGSYYQKAYEFANQHVSRYDTFKNQLILCQCMPGMGMYYESVNQLKKATDLYWEYINTLLDIYLTAPHEAAYEIMEGLVHPIRFWIYYRAFDDAQFALDAYESIVFTFYTHNPEKYVEYARYARELKVDLLDEREWV